MTDLVAGDTCDLPATAVRWVGEVPPGLVEVELTDHHGTTHTFVDKCAYFGGHENLVPEAAYPVPVDIRCDVTAVAGNIATVSTWWCSDQTGDPYVFEVPMAALRPVTRN